MSEQPKQALTEQQKRSRKFYVKLFFTTIIPAPFIHKQWSVMMSANSNVFRFYLKEVAYRGFLGLFIGTALSMGLYGMTDMDKRQKELAAMD
jgi:hypothetical protein